MSKEEGTEGGFLSRWSRRKAQVQVQQGGPVTAATTATATASHVVPSRAADAGVTGAAAGTPTTPRGHAQGSSTPADASADQARDAASSTNASESQQATGPTLSDVENLDASSDYRAFVARDVDPQVRNAAFKKMFHSDPHFNVMDGLDVYIDDYNTPNPLPVAVMKTLVQARALGLIDDELKEQDLPAPDPLPPVAAAEEAVVDAEPVSSDTEAFAAEVGTPETEVLETTSIEQLAPPGGSAEVVHVLHVEPAYGDLATPRFNGPSLASTPSTAAGTVVPFPRRPGSADPI